MRQLDAMSAQPSEPKSGHPWLVFALRWAPWAAVGLGLLLIAAFVELSEELLEPDEQPSRAGTLDAALLSLALRLRRPWLNGVAMDLTALGSPVVVTLFTLTLGAFLLVKADRRGATTLVGASLASALLTTAAKRLLERARPNVIPRLVAVAGLSYPSGHSLASAAVYLTASIVVARHLALWTERVSTVTFTSVLVALIGASRVYLGVHYPSDVLGGILLGASCALFLGVLLRRLDRRAARSETGRSDARPRARVAPSSSAQGDDSAPAPRGADPTAAASSSRSESP